MEKYSLNVPSWNTVVSLTTQGAVDAIQVVGRQEKSYLLDMQRS